MIPYVIDSVYGKTRPNLVSFTIWTILELIGIAAQIQAGASWSLVLIIVATVNTSIGVILALIGYGYKGYSSLDVICFIGAILAIILWRATNQPVLAIGLVIVADFLGLVPTIKKTYRDPDSENRLAWLLISIAAILSIFVTTKFDLANLLYPGYMVVADTTIFMLTFFGNRKNVIHQV